MKYTAPSKPYPVGRGVTSCVRYTRSTRGTTRTEYTRSEKKTQTKVWAKKKTGKCEKSSVHLRYKLIERRLTTTTKAVILEIERALPVDGGPRYYLREVTAELGSCGRLLLFICRNKEADNADDYETELEQLRICKHRQPPFPKIRGQEAPPVERGLHRLPFMAALKAVLSCPHHNTANAKNQPVPLGLGHGLEFPDPVRRFSS